MYWELWVIESWAFENETNVKIHPLSLSTARNNNDLPQESKTTLVNRIRSGFRCRWWGDCAYDQGYSGGRGDSSGSRSKRSSYGSQELIYKLSILYRVTLLIYFTLSAALGMCEGQLERFAKVLNNFSRASQLSFLIEACSEPRYYSLSRSSFIEYQWVLRNDDWSLDKVTSVSTFYHSPPSLTQLARQHNMPRKGSKRRKNRTHIKPAPNAAPDSSTSSKVPKSFVVKSGTVGNSVAQLTKDVRKVLEPNTGTRLRVSR